MPELSDRGMQMPASPIRKLVPYAEAARSKGVNVFHLNIGQPDIETPSVFMEAVRTADLRVVEYSHSAGILPLREAMAAYYQRNNLPINVNQLLVTTGGSEAIRFAFMSILNPGDEVIVPEPFYANYLGFAIESGVKLVPLTTTVDESFDLPGTEAFRAVVTDRTKAILICNPGNPTGKLYSREALESLREIVLEHDLYLIADEVYREFCYDGSVHHSILNLDGLEQNAIVIDSISKRFSACGARIGCIATQNEGVINTALKYAQARLSPPTLAQIGAVALYGLDPSYFDPIREEYRMRRNTVVDALKAIPGVTVPEAGAAFYLMVRLPVDDSEKFCQWMLQDFDYEGNTVMMAPAAGFYATPGLGRDEVRIAYVLNVEALKQAMKCLEEGLKAYPGRVEPVVADKMNG